MLLELNDAAALREDPVQTDDVEAEPLVSSPAADGGTEWTARSARPASGQQRGDVAPCLPPGRKREMRGLKAETEIPVAKVAAESSGFRKEFKINGHVGESTTRHIEL